MNPTIRFPNFKNEWKKIKLKDVLSEHKTRNKNSKFKEVFSVAKEKGIINQIEHLGRSYASDNIENYKVVFPGNVVYTKSPTSGFPFGIIKQSKLNRTGVVSVLYAVFRPETFETGALIDLFFSSTKNTYNYLVPIVRIGAKNTMNIGNNDFLNGDTILIPKSIEEQKKIADFFKSLDERLALLREKKLNLEMYKNAMISKLFSQKIRFKKDKSNDFPDWEKKPIKSLMKRFTDPVKVELNRDYIQIGIRSHGKGIFHKEAVNGNFLGNKRVFWVKDGLFTLNIVFAWERAIAITEKAENGLIASHRFPMYKPIEGILDLNYIFYFFMSSRGKSYLELASPGGAGRNKTLGQSEFENLKISIPSIEEQIKISAFLIQLDQHISDVSGQIDQCQLFKNSLLQQMFC